jgi:hypothetical protein
MNTKTKGDIAVAHAIACLTDLGYEILIPIGDKMPYDLVVDGLNGLQKVQVKYAGWNPEKKWACAHLETRGGNQSFSTTKKYADGDFDFLFVWTERGSAYFIPWSGLTSNTKLFLGENSKYNKFIINMED